MATSLLPIKLCAVRRGFSLGVLAPLSLLLTATSLMSGVRPVELRCEYLVNPEGIDADQPRLSWRLESDERAQRQVAYEIEVASTLAGLTNGVVDLWSPGKRESDATFGIAYEGQRLGSRQECYWRVRSWGINGQVSEWSSPAHWSMGLLSSSDWGAQWISFSDQTPLHQDRNKLYLPPARYYRRSFSAPQKVRRAVAYASSLGIYELQINGVKVGDGFFQPGWSDYRKRAYYQAFDVTQLLRSGDNTIGAIVADGWYAGYVGYGLLVGYGPNRVGRYFYGKAPALLTQLEIEYEDGSRQLVVSDPSWEVNDQGPVREADLIMGERYDARRHRPDWSAPSGMGQREGWQSVVLASDNRPTVASFFDQGGEREVNLGFVEPGRRQAYPGPAIRITAEQAPVEVTEPRPEVKIFNLGQNIAGVVRLQVQGDPGTEIQLRYGEMLHPDGRLMTENLRKARATDTYVLRGDPEGETWTPQFTYHGFQYVEVQVLGGNLREVSITGLVIHSDTPLASSFSCSDPMVNQLFRNIVWTQRGNFVEVPTDCPQRDERLGWMGDAQVYIRAATYNADVAAFFTKWLDDVEEAQRTFGAYPDYAPYPMQHGQPRKSFGTAWMDAGIICPWTMHQVYGDRRVIERHYDSMQRFMEFRMATSPGNLGVSIGNPWGDWLSLGENTPVEYVDVCYYAYVTSLMEQMARAIGRETDARNYRALRSDIEKAFQQEYLREDGILAIDTQTAYVLALWVGLIPESEVAASATRLAEKIRHSDFRMTTGFLGTRAILSVLSNHGYHDLAVRLFQSRDFPSWGYEVINGATTIWERWDSYTKEDGFGRHNAAMNSFSHYAFGTVCEWMFRELAGIDTLEPGFGRILIKPGPPARDSNPQQQPIEWVDASYRSIRGTIRSQWKWDGEDFLLQVEIPANCSATIIMPGKTLDGLTEGDRPIPEGQNGRVQDGELLLEVGSGVYEFRSAKARTLDDNNRIGDPLE